MLEEVEEFRREYRHDEEREYKRARRAKRRNFHHEGEEKVAPQPISRPATTQLRR